VLNGEKGEICFGDGISGRVPPGGSSIKVEKYRIGGGEEGNVPAGSAWMMGDEKKQGLSISNFKAAEGGRGAETVEEAKVRFLKELKIPYRTVTSRDFEYLAVNTPGLRVAKAKAIANYRPESGEVLGHVTVVVIPFTPLTGMEKPPEPSDEFKKIICDHLDAHRLLGTGLRVVGPIYVRVGVQVSLSANEGHDEASLRTAVAHGLDQFLDPVKGGEAGDGWPVGRPVYRSEVLDRIQKINGVDCVTEVVLSGDRGAVMDRDGNLMLPSRMATVYPGRHAVTFLRNVDRCKRVSGYGKD
jgi:predicted phage baseplate assembly protein